MRQPKLLVLLAWLAPTLFGCGDAGPTGPQTATLIMISGDNQPGDAGRQLSQPFVVRVTDHQGRGMANRTVTWTVEDGEGVFGGLETLQEVYCDSLPTQTSRASDADGIAQVGFMPTGFGPVRVTARVAGASDPVTFTTDASDSQALLTIAAGSHHTGKAGDVDEPVTEFPRWRLEWLEVRVTDGQGEPLPHIRVRWVITSGDVELRGCRQAGLDNPPTTWTLTGPDGIAPASFRLVDVGTSTVGAVVAGALPSHVSFTMTATAAVIMLSEPSYWGVGPRFVAPHGSSAVTVPVGAMVEWANFVESARIVSTSAPSGGASFDSGELGANGRFAFVPGAVGTWEYVDQVSGATGTLTAR
jgi:hypothetical protein